MLGGEVVVRLSTRVAASPAAPAPITAILSGGGAEVVAAEEEDDDDMGNAVLEAVWEGEELSSTKEFAAAIKHSKWKNRVVTDALCFAFL